MRKVTIPKIAAPAREIVSSCTTSAQTVLAEFCRQKMLEAGLINSSFAYRMLFHSGSREFSRAVERLTTRFRSALEKRFPILQTLDRAYLRSNSDGMFLEIPGVPVVYKESEHKTAEGVRMDLVKTKQIRAINRLLDRVNASMARQDLPVKAVLDYEVFPYSLGGNVVFSVSVLVCIRFCTERDGRVEYLSSTSGSRVKDQPGVFKKICIERLFFHLSEFIDLLAIGVRKIQYAEQTFVCVGPQSYAD